ASSSERLRSVRTAGALAGACWACTLRADRASEAASAPRRRDECMKSSPKWLSDAPALCRAQRHCRNRGPPPPFVRLRPPSVELRSVVGQRCVAADQLRERFAAQL